MPCRNGTDYDDMLEANARCNELSAMLCECCGVLEPLGKIPASVSEWWEKHKKFDVARKKAEEDAAKRAKEYNKDKAAALSKLASLTPAERRTLGL